MEFHDDVPLTFITSYSSFLWISGIILRLITITWLQIPNHVAIKVALELKKLLVDNSLLDVYAILT